MQGQWSGTYTGTNTGKLVADIEDAGAFFDVALCVYDSEASHPRTFVRTTIPKNTPKFDLPVNVIHYERGSGNVVPPHLYATRYPGLTLPSHAHSEWLVAPDKISISWTTNIGSQGTGELTQSARKNVADLTPISSVKTWADFKAHLLERTPYRHAFRGQSNNQWRLRTSFHRTGRTSLHRFRDVDVNALHRYLSGLTQQRFDINDPTDYAAFLNLVQHHGYPTPLLDWTQSPFVAAYFAFSDLTKDSVKPNQMVRILIFDSGRWMATYEAGASLMPGFLHVTMLEPLTINNPRAAPQQSILMVTNVDDLEGYILDRQKDDSSPYLEAIDLPASERKSAMQDLALMGITAGSLFPGVEGVCRQLKERFFEL